MTLTMVSQHLLFLQPGMRSTGEVITFSLCAEAPVIQQPMNASEKSQLITDGQRRYGDTYT